ncbi:gas vesicle protein GvpO [Isoptericola variabilis]|uniref:gas vesicle protein GvpO n=1 Tax=Isoptericola variabilis TaxID=139208 RepID=UPI003D25AAFB
MSPARKAHDVPTRRRPPATHDRAARRERSENEPPEDEPPEDEPPEDEPPDDADDETRDDVDDEAREEPDADEPDADEPDADEPGDEGPEEDPGEDDAPDEPAEDDESPDDSEPPPAGGLDAQDAARHAVRHLRELTNHRPEGVVGVARDDEGWVVTVEVLEDAHVPSTSDVLAEYEVRLDADGGLRGVMRGRRYVRGQTER